jgi:SAM-dependent methyltransferase
MRATRDTICIEASCRIAFEVRANLRSAARCAKRAPDGVGLIRRSRFVFMASAMATEHSHTPAPSTWMRRFAPLVPCGARVLDVAAGRGRHARLFAVQGAHVLAVDRDAAALSALDGVAGVTPHVADLEGAPWPFAGEVFDAIVVANYLHRPLFPHLLAGLAPDGAFLYETFASGNERFGRPSNPAFLLAPGELLDVVRDRLTLVAFEQGVIEGERTEVVQRIAAVGHTRPWPPRLPGRAV